MSIEIRRRTEGDCPRGTPQPIDAPITCRHWYECDWGILENAEVDTRHPIKHLMVTTRDVVRRLLENGPEPGIRGGIISASTKDNRLFVHLNHNGHHTTWELFPAHFEDREPASSQFLIGRWPD